MVNFFPFVFFSVLLYIYTQCGTEPVFPSLFNAFDLLAKCFLKKSTKPGVLWLFASQQSLNIQKLDLNET